MDVRWSRDNELGFLTGTRKYRDSRVLDEKVPAIKRIWDWRIIARCFRWNFEGSRNLIRTDCGILRGKNIQGIMEENDQFDKNQIIGINGLLAVEGTIRV